MSKRRGPKKPGKQSGKGAGRQPQQPAKPQQQGRPAPPVQQRAPVGKPAQKCPLPVRKPCDVVKLVLEGRYAKHTDATDSPEGQKKTSLTCDRPLRSTPLGDADKKAAGKQVAILLSRYVDIKLIASFGAKLDLGPVASAEARISLWAGLAAEWGIALATHEDQETKLEVKSTGGAKANVQATLGPITVWKREIGIESGIVVEGKLAYKGSEGKFEWAIVVRTLPTGWYFTASSARTRAAKTTVHQIFAPKQIYKADGKIGG